MKKHKDAKEKKIEKLLKEWMVEVDKPLDEPMAFGDFKNIRKIDHFGCNDNGRIPFDFEWPKNTDVIQPTADGSPVRMSSLEWQDNGSWFTGV